MDKKLLKWCEEKDVLKRTIDTFYIRFDEFKRLKEEEFKEYGITETEEENIEVHYHYVHLGIMPKKSDMLYVAVEVYMIYREEDLGFLRVKYNLDAEEIGYEFW